MTDIEAAVLNDGLGISDGNNVEILEQMDVDTFELEQKAVENVIETVNPDKEHSNTVDKLVETSPDDSNDIDEPSEVNTVQKKRQFLIDSDSEDEHIKDLDKNPSQKDTSDKDNDEEQPSQIKVQKKRITLLDSDSEDEQNAINKESNENLETEDSDKENDKPQNAQMQKKVIICCIYSI